MQQIEPKENPLGLKVFINGIPDLNAIPKEKAESIFAALELEISEYYEKTEGVFNRFSGMKAPCRRGGSEVLR